ncbi:MAG: hypothetical protein E7Z91_03465 [Cyanobacteria bacterium SIG30]|nr:hypothetical protein [Cyanobacteria bacterium SIG30]
MAKKLNIAFIWHFHQPVYQENFDSDFLMPWTRLHATKDYLDMLYRVDDFENLKLNFNISPVLLDSIEKYINGHHDIHSRLLISDIETLDEQDKGFILNNFFDANYSNLILKREYYTELYNKRFTKENITTDDFDNQEYSDIMANFTLAWFDGKLFDYYPGLKELSDKQYGYTKEDRIKIYDYTIQILKDIIPKFKEYQEKGKIEISANPYYHPILPLLLDLHEQNYSYTANLPQDSKFMEQDAYIQTKKSLDRMEELFGRRPKGIWLSEQCISEKTVHLLNDLGVSWTVSDMGILSETLGKEYLRGFDGNLESPFDLCVHYKLKSDKKMKTNILFSDSFIANLISFGYGNYEAQIAANDLYEKIKTVQDKLQNSPKSEHILTIAMDGENCWEAYENDGDEFLSILYGLIDSDPTLNTVLIGEYLENKKSVKLDNIASGSWINRNFNLWIGEPVKNLAWMYLSKTKDDIARFMATSNDEELNKKIMEEVYIAQGSDWFWWYGEPNDSGKDHIFDLLFRNHLKNAYNLMGFPLPKELSVPLISIIGKPVRHPRKKFTPKLTGLSSTAEEDWSDAGYIYLADSPTFSSNKTIKGICYGCDDENLYFRFDINKENVKTYRESIFNELYIYFKTDDYTGAPIMLSNKTTYAPPILNNQFNYEIKFAFGKEQILNSRFSESFSNFLWSLKISKNIEYIYDEVFDLCIPFSELNVQEGQIVEFCVISARNGVIDEIYPKDIMLKIVNN